MILDFFRNSIHLLKLHFFGKSNSAFSAMCLHIVFKNRVAFSPKPLIFLSKASFERTLLSASKWIFFLPIAMFALEVDPWLGNLWEFTFTPSYTYSRFREVQNGSPQLKTPFNVHLLAAGFGFAFSETWQADIDAEFADTTVQAMGYRSSGYQIRHRWSNDIAGDFVTFTTGLSVRNASSRSLRDISCPYHSNANFELNGALGKEWGHGPDWRVRAFVYAVLGAANRGSPWIRFLVPLEVNGWDRHYLTVFLDGYFGFGPNGIIHTRHFRSYASIHHQSLDTGARYAYHFDIWGHLDFTYAYRFYAHAFPENVNSFTVSYTLPFSFF